MKLNDSLFGTDQNGNEVFMMKGDTISEISDAGHVGGAGCCEGWEVTILFQPKHKNWKPELVTVDAVKLLKALE